MGNLNQHNRGYRMNYLIMIGCEDPFTAKPFTMLTSDENMVYGDYSDAIEVVRIMNEQNGEGYARLINL